MTKLKDIGEFPIEKIYLVSAGVEQALDVVGSSTKSASDKSMEKIYLVPKSDRPEVAMEISSAVDLARKKS